MVSGYSRKVLGSWAMVMPYHKMIRHYRVVKREYHGVVLKYIDRILEYHGRVRGYIVLVRKIHGVIRQYYSTTISGTFN